MSNKTDVSKWCEDTTTDVLLLSRDEQYEYLKDLIELEIPLSRTEMHVWMSHHKF
jgi:hypothetical protein